MNRKKIFLFILFAFVLGFSAGVGISYVRIKDNEANNNILGEKIVAFQENEKKRKLVYQEIAPDGQRKILLYKMPFLGKGELDYKNYLANQYLFAVKTFSDGREKDIFINNDKTGYPHWLGNEHIFFTGGCGTGCQTLYLVNVNSKESRQGFLASIPLQDNEIESRFTDWFAKNFAFHGAIQQIRSVFLEGQIYLIFQVKDQDESVREEKFLFTKTRLEAL